jgi:hypothetical protein
MARALSVDLRERVLAAEAAHEESPAAVGAAHRLAHGGEFLGRGGVNRGGQGRGLRRAAGTPAGASRPPAKIGSRNRPRSRFDRARTAASAPIW